MKGGVVARMLAQQVPPQLYWLGPSKNNYRARPNKKYIDNLKSVDDPHNTFRGILYSSTLT